MDYKSSGVYFIALVESHDCAGYGDTVTKFDALCPDGDKAVPADGIIEEADAAAHVIGHNALSLPSEGAHSIEYNKTLSHSCAALLDSLGSHPTGPT